MDLFTVTALAGMVYAGKTLSKKKESFLLDDSPAPEIREKPISKMSPLPQESIHAAEQMPFFGRNNNSPGVGLARATTGYTGVYNSEQPVAGVRPPKREVPGQPMFADIGHTRRPQGEINYEITERFSQNITNRLNNLSPVEKQNVGPGIGIGPNVPAFGGYQQLYRTMPNNVGGYKLTTLPGRIAPGGALAGRGIAPSEGTFGEITHYKPTTVTEQWSRRPPARGRAGGQGGQLQGSRIRERYVYTERPTCRSETTMRSDTLGFNPAGSFVPGATSQDNPTRNKGDLNQQRVNDVASPGISNFVGGYEVAPLNIRPAVNRGKEGRKGNAGRMNVRMDALNQGGAITATKMQINPEYTGTPGPTGSMNQTYVQDKYYQLNAYKGQKNFQASSRALDLTKNVLKNNPFAHPLA